MDQTCHAAIHELECRLTASRRRTWAVVCLGGLAVLMGQSEKEQSETPAVVRTERLEIVNDSGQVVLTASADTLGAGQLLITHADGMAIVSIGQQPYDELSSHREALERQLEKTGVGPHRSIQRHPPAMTLIWPNGSPLAVIGHETEHGPTVAVYPKTGGQGKRLKLGTHWLVE